MVFNAVSDFQKINPIEIFSGGVKTPLGKNAYIRFTGRNMHSFDATKSIKHTFFETAPIDIKFNENIYKILVTFL